MVYQQKSILILGFRIFYIFTSRNILNIVTGSHVQEFYGKTWLIFLPIFLQTMYIWSLDEQYGWKCIWYSCFCATSEFVIGCFKVGSSMFTVYYNIYFNFIYLWWVVTELQNAI